MAGITGKTGRPLLTVRHLSIEFHDHLIPETVVHDFNLALYPGETVGIVGESGSGKSMCALAVAGLLSRRDMQKRGEILFDGQDLLTCPRSVLRQYQGKDIGMIFQEPLSSLNPVKRIGWQVEESLRIHTKLSPGERYERTIQMLREVELTHPERVYTCYPHELSGGMRQRVMIASAMILRPRLLIADEPTTALDVTVQGHIVSLLKRLSRESNTAVLFISHDLSLIDQLCGQLMVMHDGWVVESGSAGRIFRQPEQDYTRKLIAAIPVIPIIRPVVPASVTEPAIHAASAASQGTAVHKPIVEVRNLSAFYTDRGTGGFKKGKRQQVLFDLSFAMQKGEILGLAGESGSGKSTLVKTILGMNRDYTGTVLHDTRSPQMIFQDPYGSLNPVRKVGWILEEPLRLSGGWERSDRKRKVMEMLYKVGLDERLAERYPAQLSGGQRQRICIAAALMQEPALLIADEPVSALDVTIQSQVLELLLSLQKEMGLSILFISHDLRVIYRMCSRVMIMRQGVICEEGSREDIFYAPATEYTRQLLKGTGWHVPVRSSGRDSGQ